MAQTHSLGKAVGWMVVAALFFSTMTYFVKNLTATLPHMEIVFFRAFFNLLSTIPFFIILKENPTRSFQPILVFRALMGFTALHFFFTAIDLLPISVASLLNWGSPIFVLLFSPWITGEVYSRKSFGWVILALLGVYFLVGGGVPTQMSGVEIPLTGLGAGLLGAIASAFAYLAIRRASGTVPSHTIIFYFTSIATVLAALAGYSTFRVPYTEEWLPLIGMGVTASIGQYAMTQGYRYAPAGVVSTLMLMTAMFSAIYGYFLLDERLSPLQWSGLVLMGIGIALVSRAKVEKSHKMG